MNTVATPADVGGASTGGMSLQVDGNIGVALLPSNR